MPRLEVSPAQRHPASQQGGRGRWKPGWRSLGEVGGWRLSTIFFFFKKTKWKWKFSLEFVKFPNTCVLWIGGPVPCTSFQPSWGGGDERSESESHHICICLLTFLRISVLDTVLRTKVLVQWFNKFKLSSLLLQSKNIRQTSRKKIILLDSAAAHLYNNIQWHTKYTCLQSIPNTPQGHLTMEQHPLDFSRASAVSAASIR